MGKYCEASMRALLSKYYRCLEVAGEGFHKLPQKEQQSSDISVPREHIMKRALSSQKFVCSSIYLLTGEWRFMMWFFGEGDVALAAAAISTLTLFASRFWVEHSAWFKRSTSTKNKTVERPEVACLSLIWTIYLICQYTFNCHHTFTCSIMFFFSKSVVDI